MNKLNTDAATYTECADALASMYANAEANCACWNAMGEEYRTNNFDCLPDGSQTTVMDTYNSMCVQTTSNKKFMQYSRLLKKRVVHL